MKCKYKKFLKAAYIDYEEDYCSNAVLRSSRPPQSEILAPATFDVTLNYADGYYWATFYTSMANYQAPDGVRVYKVNLNGSQFTSINVEDGIINKRQGVMLRSSTSSITLTKTYSKSSDDYSNNSLIGTDYEITNPGNAYVLNYRQSHGLSFYHLSDTGRIKANTAYLVIPITYLTQWKIVGNSEVHTDPFLTSWKITGRSSQQEYLTQWKVEGNSYVYTETYPDDVVLPNGYKRCKYLEFHGTEYINSGIVNRSDIGFSLDLSTTSNSKTIIGGRSSNNLGVVFGHNYVSGGNTNKIYFAYGEHTIEYIVQTNIGDGLLHHIVLDGQQAKIDNESVEITRGDTFPQQPIFIGTWNNNNVPDSRMFVGKIYSVVLYCNDGNLFYGIPCLDNNNVPCLYDAVSGTSFYNAGTGTFGYEEWSLLVEIRSCGDYSAVDGKYHVKIDSGWDVCDIALDEPLRKVGNVADTIEFPSGTEGKALLTRNLKSIDAAYYSGGMILNNDQVHYRYLITISNKKGGSLIVLTPGYTTSKSPYSSQDKGISCGYAANNKSISFYNDNYCQSDSAAAFRASLQGNELIYELETPTTELIDVPQIHSSDDYWSATTTPYSAFTYATPQIYSCGDYSEVDGKYHVKISNGVTIYDIPLDAPLRKIENISDTIEFPSNTDGKALVTRNIAIAWWKNMSIIYQLIDNQTVSNYERFFTTSLNGIIGNTSGLNTSICLSANYEQHSTPVSLSYVKDRCMCVYNENVYIRDIDCHSKADFEAKNANNYFFYVLATPTTELVDVSPFPVSPTDTYTSVNTVSFYKFEHKKNTEIWSCGEYNATDGKYHILVQPLGGSIADIALTEPLRKVNDVADTIEFPSSVEGKALVTRPLKSVLIGDCSISRDTTNTSNIYRWRIATDAKASSINVLCPKYAYTSRTYYREDGIGVNSSGGVVIFDSDYSSDVDTFKAANADVEVIYELATPTTELVDAPQIEEADSYSCVISQGGKAVSWSNFTTE